MNEKIKKILAREGMIFAIFVFPFLFMVILSSLIDVVLGAEAAPAFLTLFVVLATLLAGIGYPMYLIARFNIWVGRVR